MRLHKKFCDLGWTIKVYDLGYGIQETIEKMLMPFPNAIMPLELCIASQNTHFQSTFNFLHGLRYGI